MSKVVDRIRQVLGRPARIAGAAYTDEWWGDIPPAPPQTHIEGVHVDLAGIDVRPRVAPPPAPPPQDDWEAVIRAAKGRSQPISLMQTPPTPVPAYALGWLRPAAAARTTPEEDWEQVIRKAKLRAAERGEPDDWEAVIRRAKHRAA